MIRIYIDNINWETAGQLIKFANRISLKISKDFFEKHFGKKAETIRKDYFNFFSENKCVFLPIESETKLKFSEKHFLKNPKNIFQYPNQFEQFVKIIKIEKSDLCSLDEVLSPLFETGYKGADRIYIINNSELLSQYEDVVSGINSPKIEYLKGKNFEDQLEIFKRVLLGSIREYWGKSNSDKLNFWFKIGTTAIPYKKLY